MGSIKGGKAAGVEEFEELLALPLVLLELVALVALVAVLVAVLVALDDCPTPLTLRVRGV